ncbi:MAG: efflux RND transporter periplasmic adaptor subunit [Ignavibacteria bacterium]|nr:efflux RND transporter periplasmic adaptor subunit [Ignavibacteria bacterium]
MSDKILIKINMKRNLILLLCLTFLISSCGKKEEKTENNKKLPLVKVMTIEHQPFSEELTVLGVVKPYASAKLSSEEGGLITYIKKDKGDFVHRGEVLVRLKFDIQDAAYRQALSQYELARSNFERMEKLYWENVATEQEYTNSKLQMEIAEKSVEVLKVRLKNGYIQSPINGVVEAKYMNKGEMTGPGSPILSVVDISRVKVEAGIPEKYLTQVEMGRDVKIRFDVLPGEEYDGKISYISPTINPQTRTFDIEVILINYNRTLKPEMSAKINISTMNINEAVILQQDLIIDNVEEKYVFVLENDIARKKILNLGGRNGNNVLIENGLQKGDKLIYIGFQGLSDGDKVQVTN